MQETIGDHRAHTFDHPTLWLCYYFKKGPIPPPHYLNKLIKPSQIETTGFKLLDEADQKDRFIHANKVIARLEKSLEFLKKHVDFYTKFPPVFEMDYLRNGINAWKGHLMSYHNTLDQYFTDIALYARLIYYESIVLYNEKREELQTRYAKRDQDEKLQTQYERASAELERWRREKEAQGAKVAEQSFNMATGRTFKSITDHTHIELFNNLEAEFILRLILFNLNKSYIDGQWGSPEKKEALEHEIETLKSEAEKKYGKKWEYLFRNPQTGELPGGLIRDKHFSGVKAFFWRLIPTTAYTSPLFKTAVRPPDIKNCQLCQTFRACRREGIIEEQPPDY